MKVSEAWEDLRDWLLNQSEFKHFSPDDILDKMDEMEMTHE